MVNAYVRALGTEGQPPAILCGKAPTSSHPPAIKELPVMSNMLRSAADAAAEKLRPSIKRTSHEKFLWLYFREDDRKDDLTYVLDVWFKVNASGSAEY